MRFYKFVIKLISPFVKFFLRVKIVDLRSTKDLPERTIICANHLSNWDPILTVVATGLPINFLAKESVFKVPVLKNIIKAFGAFPVSRSGQDASAIKKSIEIIKSGGCFSLFPQGTRLHIEPQADQAKKGVGFICGKAESGVLPVGIYTKNYKIKFLRKIVVTIGDVIKYEDIDFGPEGNDYLNASQHIFGKICRLAKSEIK